MSFSIAAQRVRGQAHRKNHTPCQDACRIAMADPGQNHGLSDREASDELVVAAVADGGGSRALSHVGARLTVSLAVAAMTARWTASALDQASAGELEEFWKALCEDCRTLLRLEAEAPGASRCQEGRTAGAFACTLVAFMATRNRLTAAQVGDGFLVFGRLPAEGGADGAVAFDYRLVFQNRETEEAGQVVWLTASNWADDLRIKTLDEPVGFVVASSDGMEKPVLRLDDGEPSQLVPHSPYFEQLRHGCLETAKEAGTAADARRRALDEYLSEVMSSPRLDDRTDDDKSMAVAVWTET